MAAKPGTIVVMHQRRSAQPLVLNALLALVACGGKGEPQSDSIATASGGSAGSVGAGGSGLGGTNSGGTNTEGPIGCTNPAAFIDENTGFVSCEGGFMHRVAQGACPLHPPTNEIRFTATGTCHSDTDCAGGAQQICARDPLQLTIGCVRECAVDSDCPAGRICLCGARLNYCVPSNCSLDASCGSGLLCASYQFTCNPSVVAGFACQIRDDVCTTDGACAEPKDYVRICGPSGARRDCLAAGACGG